MHHERTARSPDLSTEIAMIAAFAAGVTYSLGLPGLMPGLAIAIVLLPVWWGPVTRHRSARWLLGLGLAAIVCGLALTHFNSTNEFDLRNMVVQSMTMLTIIATGSLLVWVQTVIGSPATVLLFGLGSLANVLLIGVSSADPLKYSWMLPIAVTALGLALMTRSPLVELLTLIGLAGLAVVADTRSVTGFLLIAAAVLLWQRAKRPGRPTNRLVVVGVVALVGVSGYSLFQSLLLDGVLGDAAAQRTQAQLATGSLIAGARPELGASVALVTARPQGYGSGAIPTGNDVWIAKSGMDELNYDPNNGYVERYMFGGRFETHSVIGDFWIWFGPVGAIAALVVGVAGVHVLIRRIASGTATGTFCFLLVFTLWNLGFSPAEPSIPFLLLAWALAFAPPTHRRVRDPRVDGRGPLAARRRRPQGTHAPRSARPLT